MTRVGAWAVRAVWFVLPLATGPAIADALDGASSAVQLAAAAILWGGWTATLVATLVPRAASLTAVRLAAPAAAVAVVAAAVHGPTGGDDAVALAAVVLVLAAAWTASTADAFVDGSSYGDERRFTLRNPVPLLLTAAPVAWCLAVAAPAAGVLLLAAEAWVPGAALVVLAVPGIRLGVPALHRLSRRWLVIVPAGLVVHDHVALPDPILLRRGTLRSIGPALAEAAGDEATLDVSLGAPGLVVALELVEPTELPVAEGRGRSRTVATRVARRVLVTPARPGAFLAAVEARRLPRA